MAYGDYNGGRDGEFDTTLGRWPANVVLDDLAAMALDEQTGDCPSKMGGSDPASGHWGNSGGCEGVRRDDSGGASRFYKIAKPSREERDMGCYDLPLVSPNDVTGRTEGSAGSKHGRAGMTGRARGNIHPTVKPVALMRWLVKLVTPIGGTVIDPFLGSGTTGMACVYEQRELIGIERETEYVEIAKRRIAAVAPLFTSEESA